MKLNEVQEFKLDYNERKSCKLFDSKGKKLDTYYIKKIEDGFEAFRVKELTDDDYVGNIQCKDARILAVYVSEESTSNARRCGIGSTLSALCMIDIEVNRGDGITLNLDRYFKDSGVKASKVKAIIKKVKKECTNMVGLYMAADIGGGNTYFEAANMVGYMRMILFSASKKHNWISLDVENAQKCYNEKTLTEKDWFFCKGKKSSKPPQSLPSCSISKR